jgi:hypothetical protein
MTGHFTSYKIPPSHELATRTGPSLDDAYTMTDIGLSAFSIFFMGSPSFLAHQRALEEGHGRWADFPGHLSPSASALRIPDPGHSFNRHPRPCVYQSFDGFI